MPRKKKVAFQLVCPDGDPNSWLKPKVTTGFHSIFPTRHGRNTLLVRVARVYGAISAENRPRHRRSGALIRVAGRQQDKGRPAMHAATDCRFFLNKLENG